MSQKLINIIFGVGIIFAIVLLILPDEEKTTVVPTIDYSSYKQRFEEQAILIDSLFSIVNKAAGTNDTIKLILINDDKKTDILNKHGLDSAFNTLLKPNR